MRKSRFIRAAVLVALLLLGLVVWRIAQTPHVRATTTASLNRGKYNNAAERGRQTPLADSDQQTKLGDITSVPLQELMDVLANKRPEEVAALARELDRRNAIINRSKVSALFKAWAATDPHAAVETALSLHDPALRATAVSATIEGVSPASASAVAGALVHPPDDGSFPRGALLTKALGKRSQADPAAAASMLNSSEAESAWGSASDGRPAMVVVTETFGTV